MKGKKATETFSLCGIRWGVNRSCSSISTVHKVLSPRIWTPPALHASNIMNASFSHVLGLRPWIKAVTPVTALETACVYIPNTNWHTWLSDDARNKITTPFHWFLVRERPNLSLDSSPQIHKQALEPRDLGFKRSLAVKPPHQLLVDRPEMGDILLQRRGMSLLLLPVLAHRLSIAAWPPLCRRALLGGLRGLVRREHLGMDMKTGMGVGEVGPRRVASVRVGTLMVLAIVQEVVKEAVHWADARNNFVGEVFGGTEIGFPFVHHRGTKRKLQDLEAIKTRY